MVKMVYAIYLVKKGRNNEALKYLNDAIQLDEDNANLYYNIGLVYLDLNQFDKALHYAHRAYQMGFQLPGLRDRLKRAGKWSEPVVAPISGPKLDQEKESEEVAK